MNIVHVAPNAPYNEGWGYQENLLPKYQVKLGCNVSLVITTNMHKDGTIINVNNEDYMSPDGFRVIRRPKHCPPIWKIGRLLEHIDVFELLKELKPDMVFLHGLVSATIFQIAKYKRRYNPSMIIVADNHLDYQISTLHLHNFTNNLLRMNYRLIYFLNNRYIDRVYGVTPWRKNYAHKVFGVPKSKIDLLIMGADDEKLDFSHKDEIKEHVRNKYGILKDEFLIITGGKIDRNKNIHILMRAVENMPKVKLLIFGNVLKDIEEEFYNICKTAHNIVYIGWIQSSQVYDYFFAGDLVFFPGQHSVLWEQACASKVPCLFEKWEGMDHVNVGGNSDFIRPIDVQSIQQKINELKFTQKYKEMKQVAESKATDVFLYSQIAKKSLECIH